MRRSLAAIRELMDRSLVEEGMGILWGIPGEGKSTAISYVSNRVDGIYLRAQRTWTSMASLLDALIFELGLPPTRFIHPMMKAVTKRLMEDPRMIFLDEIDYILKGKSMEMLDVMRDIYDITGVPVVLIGMESSAVRIQARGRFARRISQWVEFNGIDLEDARVVAETLCEVKIADDLLEYAYRQSKTNIDRIVKCFCLYRAHGENQSFGNGHPQGLG